MMKTIRDSGWRGPVGILDHRPETDSEETLRANLAGLQKLRQQLADAAKKQGHRSRFDARTPPMRFLSSRQSFQARYSHERETDSCVGRGRRFDAGIRCPARCPGRQAAERAGGPDGRSACRRDRAGRQQIPEDAEHRPAGQGGGQLPQHLLHHVAVFAQPGQSILSGLYAHAHGVTNNFTEYPLAFKSFPVVLQAAGYDTAYIGKWHMGEENDEPRPGFDYFVTHKGQGKYFDTEFNFNGQRREVVRATTRRRDRHGCWSGCSRPRGDKPWLPDAGAQGAAQLLLSRAEVRTLPSTPSACPIRTRPFSWTTSRPGSRSGCTPGTASTARCSNGGRSSRTTPEAVKDFENMTHAYWGTILSVDDSVGRLYDWLGQSGQLDNTVIVFMGDNGLLNGEHGMVDKRTMHEAEHPHPAGRALPRPDARRAAEGRRRAGADRGRCAQPAGTGRRTGRWRTSTAGRGCGWFARAIPSWRTQLVLSLQLREAVPVHAQCPRRAHGRVEVHPLPARRRRDRTGTGPSCTTSRIRSRGAPQPDRQPEVRRRGEGLAGGIIAADARKPA